MPAATLMAAAVAKADATAALITTISGCAIVGYTVSSGKTDAAISTPATNSRVENKAVFVFRTAVGKKASFSFPNPLPAVVNANGGIISGQADCAALIADLLAGYCDSNGQDLTALVQDAQVFSATTRTWHTTDVSPTA